MTPQNPEPYLNIVAAAVANTHLHLAHKWCIYVASGHVLLAPPAKVPWGAHVIGTYHRDELLNGLAANQWRDIARYFTNLVRRQSQCLPPLRQ